MVATVFTLVSGTYVDEQDLLAEVDFFLTQTVQGWTRSETVVDTGSDKHFAYYTDGSDPGFYDRAWFTLQATSDELRLSGHSSWDSGSGNDSFGGNGVAEISTSSSSGTYWIAANEDSFHLVIQQADTPTNIFHAGAGHFNTYYNVLEDPKPTYVFGQASVGLDFSSGRVSAYGPHSWGTSYDVVSSGVSRTYEASHPVLIGKGTPNPRTGEPKFIEPVFFSDSSFMHYEIRGEVPGLYMCGGTDLLNGNVITVTGTLGTVSGTYFINRYTDDISWAIGPVVPSGSVF